MKYKPLKGLVVAAMLASSLVLAAPQALAAGPEPSVVTVTGYAQQEVAPDTAYVTIGTTSTDAPALFKPLINDSPSWLCCFQ